MISTSYRILLQQAYAFGNTSPDNEMFSRPKNQIKRTIKRRITRDKQGNLIIHRTATISATATRSSKCDTTEQAARASIYGRILGAAEDRQGFDRDLLRYIYSPLCSSASAISAFWGLVAAIQPYTIGLTSRQQYRVCCVIPTVIRDQMQVYRGGQRLSTDADICRIMGVRPSHYADHWLRHIQIIRSMIDRTEYRASLPVRDIVTDMLSEPLTETGT